MRVPYIFHQSDFCDCLSVCVPVYVGQGNAIGKILSSNIDFFFFTMGVSKLGHAPARLTAWNWHVSVNNGSNI